MKDLYLFVGIYIIFFSLYMIYFHFTSKKKKMIEVIYLEKRYHLNLSKVNYYILCRSIALINAFIMTSALFILNYIENIFIKVLLVFSTIFVLIIILYGILGIYYRRKTDE